MNPLVLASRVQESFRSDLGDVGAFLPARAPLEQLPEPFQRYLDACHELAEHYPQGRGGVRAWLQGRFPRFDADASEALFRLSSHEQECLLTALAALGHTFRWDTVPPSPERLRERRVAIPEGIDAPWTALATLLGQPRVGTMWSLHLCNWHLVDRPGGSAYKLADLTMERLRVAHQWLAAPESSHLERFSLSFVVMEARGAEAVRCLVDAIAAAARGQVRQTAYRLELLQAALFDMGKAFSTNIRNAVVDPKTWLELVQPTFAWGEDEDGRPLPGPNGLQMPSIHALDAGLGFPAGSMLASQATAARGQMPEPHRRFLASLDAARGLLRGFVEDSGAFILRRRYNDCIRTLTKFRISHRARGAHYLDAGRFGSSGRISTGMGIEWRPPEGTAEGGAHTIASASGEGAVDAVAEFERRMNERIREMDAALLTGDGRGEEPTVENTFRSLSAQERASLLGNAPRRSFAKGDAIIRQGERLHALFMIEEGFVRIEKRTPSGAIVVARLWPGEIFGELSFLTYSDATAWAIADADVDVRVLERTRVYDMAAESTTFSARFYESLAVLVANRLRDVNALLETFMVAPGDDESRSQPPGAAKEEDGIER